MSAAESQLYTIFSSLRNQPVYERKIAGNSLILFMNAKPFDDNTIAIWCEPPWRLERHGTIVSTSADFSWEQEKDETDAAYKARFESACAPTGVLSGIRLKEIVFVPGVWDLVIHFDNDYTLKTFSVWHDEYWCICHYQSQMYYKVSQSGVRIEPMHNRREH